MKPSEKSKKETIPHASELEAVGRATKTLTCNKNGWRCVVYRETPTSKIKYFCLKCDAWVEEGVAHYLTSTIAYIMSPKKVKK